MINIISKLFKDITKRSLIKEKCFICGKEINESSCVQDINKGYSHMECYGYKNKILFI